ncbi:hypothetical protein CC1G_09073 [Coprinopsis cinerea okayama7|uniref:MYND-type domain-containing protein n=1 Tax=Coprinopsis cinerea (strain Okayama-7 / 130 / ATCC MYA-4618 / FGSC 9003) TaxID=240176 RepID=A8P313_COPC7|nr:hypothetical protein CC1G_09073 [Coprinopsis cinerea okayama7\|eukprot:XP_001838445.1 hypothetical protein CC1G_09073 [Coprinopsis cinerea okayama7\
MSRIPAYLIERAKNGDELALRHLSDIVTPENYTLAALDATLAHLRIEKLPTNPSEVAAFSGICRGALQCFSACISNCYRGPTYIRATISKVMDQMDDILSWVNVFTAYVLGTNLSAEVASAALHLAVLTVVILMRLEPQVEDQILCSPKTVTFFLKSWNDRRCDNGMPFVFDNVSGCPLVTLFARYLGHPEGYDLLVESITSSRRRLAAFCDSYVLRITVTLKVLESEPGFDMPNYIFTLLSNLPQIASKSVLIHRGLRESRMLDQSIRTLVTLSPQIDSKQKFGMSALVLHAAYQRGADPIKGVVEVLRAGMMRPLVLGMLTCPDTGFGENAMVSRLCDSVVRAWRGFSFYPAVIRALKEAVATVPKEKWVEFSTKRALNTSDVFHTFVGGIDERYAMMEAVENDGIDFCDNYAHKRRPRKRLSQLSQCSRCRTVVYCSHECQKEDWVAGHRDECYTMRLSHLKLRREGVRYSPSSRAYHLHLTSVALNLRHREWDRLARRYYPDKDPRDCVVVVDFTGEVDEIRAPTLRKSRGLRPSDPARIIPVDVYLQQHWNPERWETFSECDAAEKRAVAIVEDAFLDQLHFGSDDSSESGDDSAEGSRNGGVDRDGEVGEAAIDDAQTRIVESLFCWNGGYRISLLGEFKPEATGAVEKWKPVRHVARIQRKIRKGDVLGFLDFGYDE